MYRWHDSVFALKSQRDGAALCFLLNSSDNSWSEVPLTGVPQGYFWDWPAIDQDSDRVCFKQDYMEDDQLVMSVLVGRLTVNEGLATRDATEKKWRTDKKSLLGETGPNVRLSEPGKRIWPAFGMSFILHGAELYIPYSVAGLEVTHSGKTLVTDGSKGPFKNGVLHSADLGKTWQVEQISDRQAWSPSVCMSKENCYYFAVKLNDGRDQLWFARKPLTGGSWDAPILVTKTYVYGYIAAPQGDTVHLCWLDRRHEKRRLNLLDPDRNNFEVAYCQRKDSDANWSKDVILSEGLLYSYSPSMSVEGDKIVVAWAGVQKAKDWHKFRSE